MVRQGRVRKDNADPKRFKTLLLGDETELVQHGVQEATVSERSSGGRAETPGVPDLELFGRRQKAICLRNWGKSRRIRLAVLLNSG